MRHKLARCRYDEIKRLTSSSLPSHYSPHSSTGHPVPFPCMVLFLVTNIGQRYQISRRRFVAGYGRTNALTAIAFSSSQLRGWPRGRSGPARSPSAHRQPSWLAFR